jgi:16S rRNA (guanine(966)-N(2))-methyltransferase RsmD
MRIIGGKHKGRKIFAPKNLPARPTKDITKESLFNALNNRFFFNEINVLDLFAGTGNISFEFASRGTPYIVAVDKHRQSTKFIEKTAKQLDLPVNVIQSDVMEFLKYPPAQPFDVVFMDPPYDIPDEMLTELIDLIFENHFLSPSGILVIEHHKSKRLDKHPMYRKSKTYGQSVLSYFEKQS